MSSTRTAQAGPTELSPVVTSFIVASFLNAGMDARAIEAQGQSIKAAEPAMLPRIMAYMQGADAKATEAQWIKAFTDRGIYRDLGFATMADYLRDRFKARIAYLVSHKPCSEPYAVKLVRNQWDHLRRIAAAEPVAKASTTTDAVTAFFNRTRKGFAALSIADQYAVLVKLRDLHTVAKTTTERAAADRSKEWTTAPAPTIAAAA
jgi:hypothetical protein